MLFLSVPNMPTKKTLFIIPFILLLISCKSQLVYHSIEFENPYKFNNKIEENLAKDTLDWKHQMAAGEYALKGDYQNALKQWDLAFIPKSHELSEREKDSILEDYNLVSAKDYIISQAQKHQIIIINEAHHSSAHRVFTTILLQELYEQEYRNLGLEALGNGKNLDPSLNERGYPIQESGYYTKDPQFGNLIRTALKIGYTLFPYEQDRMDSDGKHREIAQAENIKNFIDQNPNGKTLIHCGFGHVMEGNVPQWGKAMAGRLKEFTGIDPLTIDQTKYSERSDSLFNDPLLKALNLKEPSVLIDRDKNPMKRISNESFTDIAVFHPNTIYRNNRPTWILEPDKKDFEIELKNLPISFPVMVLAYLQNEDFKTGVPMDLIEIQNSKQIGHLALRNGNYNVLVTNENNVSVLLKINVD